MKRRSAIGPGAYTIRRGRLNLALDPFNVAGVSEEPTPSAWSRFTTYLRTNRSRVARFALLIALLYAVTDLVSSSPRDATLSLPLDDARTEARAAGQSGDEVEITIVEPDSGEPLTHTRARLAPDDRELRHEVHLAPGTYGVRLDVPGAETRRSHFEIPADGVVRVRWSAPR